MDKGFLEDCLERGLSLEAIGAELGKHPFTVSYWLKKFGLNAAGKAQHAPKGMIDTDACGSWSKKAFRSGRWQTISVPEHATIRDRLKKARIGNGAGRSAARKGTPPVPQVSAGRTCCVRSMGTRLFSVVRTVAFAV